MKKSISLLSVLFLSSSILSQEVFVAQSVSCSISFPRKFRFVVSYNLNLVSPVKMESNVAITLLGDLKFTLYDNHIGSSVLKKYDQAISSNIALSYGLFFSQHPSKEEAYLPVFTSYYANSFNNIYKLNLGFTTTHIFQFGLPKIKDTFFYQRTGAFVGSYEDWYWCYNNDGGPGLNLIGDGLDRFWTGGLTIGRTIRRDSMIHQIDLMYEKFTGYSKGAYKASGLLKVDNVLYKDQVLNQFSLNTSVVSVKYLNHNTGLGGSINYWNPQVDLQDFIHEEITHDPFHHKIEKRYLDISLFKNYTF